MDQLEDVTLPCHSNFLLRFITKETAKCFVILSEIVCQKVNEEKQLWGWGVDVVVLFTLKIITYSFGDCKKNILVTIEVVRGLFGNY